MTTPPPVTPPPAPGSSVAQLLQVMLSSATAQAAVNAQVAQQLQAMMHMQQTYGSNLPSGAPASAHQGLAQQLMGSQMPVPVAAPTVAWMRGAATQFASQVLLNRPQGMRPGRGVTPPATPHGGVTQSSGGSGGLSSHGNAPVPSPAVHGSSGGGGGRSWGRSAGSAGSGGGQVPNWGSGGTGMGNWARNMAPRIGYMAAGPWGAVAGAGLAAASEIPAEMVSQRDKNAYYQSIEGGSNASGFGERASEWLYGLKTMGVFSSSEASQAFKGVTQLGYNSKVSGGQGRNDALNFVYNGKASYGASVPESLQELQVASQSALINFKDLSTALKDVSDSAGKAGINAQMARSQMTSLMSTAINNGYGGSAVSSSALQQQNVTQLGRSFENTDVSGRLSPQFSMMAASLAGTSVSSYITGSATSQAAAQQTVDTKTLQAVLPQGAAQWIQGQLATYGGAGSVSQADVATIANQLLVTFYPDDPYALAAVVSSLAQINVGSNAQNAAIWVVQQFNKNTVTTAAAQVTSSAAATATAANAQVSGSVGMSAHTGMTPYSGGSISGSSSAITAYQSWDKSNQKSDPVITDLLNTLQDQNQVQVSVTTPSGQRVVSLQDAIQNHMDELATGNSVIMAGSASQKGKTVADLLGASNVAPNRDFSAEATTTDTSGTSMSQWMAQNGNSSGLTIDLSPAARQLLTVLQTTGLSGSASSASPPSSPYASSATRTP